MIRAPISNHQQQLARCNNCIAFLTSYRAIIYILWERNGRTLWERQRLDWNLKMSVAHDAGKRVDLNRHPFQSSLTIQFISSAVCCTVWTLTKLWTSRPCCLMNRWFKKDPSTTGNYRYCVHKDVDVRTAHTFPSRRRRRRRSSNETFIVSRGQ